MQRLSSLSTSSTSSLQSVYVSNAPTLATIISSSVGSLLDGFGVNNEVKTNIDETTQKSLAKCDTYNKDFTFHTIQIYARPTVIGQHNIDNNQTDKTYENKNNAEKASKGYHHALVVLSSGHPLHPEPLQFVLDRVEGIRFVRVNMIEEELMCGHLILIKEYNDINLKYCDKFRSFVIMQSIEPYNVANNNCLHFVFKFIVEVIKKSEWKNFDNFWNFVKRHFNAKDIKSGKYNTQQNHFATRLSKKKLLYQEKIRLVNEENMRWSWKKGDQLLISSSNFKGQKS
eukprot:183916_1